MSSEAKLEWNWRCWQTNMMRGGNNFVIYLFLDASTSDSKLIRRQKVYKPASLVPQCWSCNSEGISLVPKSL